MRVCLYDNKNLKTNINKTRIIFKIVKTIKYCYNITAMKNKRLLLLLPVVILASCKGVDITIDYERALEYSKHILNQQNKDTFQLKNTFYYESETLTSNNTATKKSTVYSGFKVFFDKTERYVSIINSSIRKTEGETASISKVTETYIYVKDGFIYEIYNDSETKTYIKLDIEDGVNQTQAFYEYVSSKETDDLHFDYKCSEHLDIEALEQDEKAKNEIDGISTNVTLTSSRNTDLKITTETIYTNFEMEPGVIIEQGKLKEFYQWEECYFVKQKMSSYFKFENGNEVTNNFTTSLVFDFSLKENKDKVSYNYIEDLSEYTDITPTETEGD